MRSPTATLRVLARLLRGASGANHAERLDNFYRAQATDYDAFRERLLRGRRTLIERLAPAPGEYWTELGGGTGRNLEFLGERIHHLRRIDVIDLCAPLLAQAENRCQRWSNVHLELADATAWTPQEPVDVIYFSYALSMMPTWREAIANASTALATGGRLGVVDFFVSRGDPAPGRVRHSWAARSFWPRWFRHDGVLLSPELPDHLLAQFPGGSLTEHSARIPWMAGLRAPYFVFTVKT